MDPQAPQQQPQQPVPTGSPMPEPMPMSMPPKSGGSKVWMVIAILAILILIGGGIYAFMRMSSYNANVSNLNSELSTANEKANTLQAAADASSTLTITEFGVQIPKPADAKEAFYFVGKTAPSNAIASFSSPALQALAAQNPATPAVNNACGLNSAPLGTITKVEAGTLVKGVKIEDLKDTDVLIVKKQDVSYYVYNAPAAMCSTVKVVQDLQNVQAKSLQEAFKNITVSK